MIGFAHPDDESFSCGITAAKYAANGWSVHLLCATRGEAGESGIYETVSRDRLKEIRVSETGAAARILGIGDVRFLDYRDGKMSDLTPGDLEDTVFRYMLELSPDIVITFETNGISNHPDHVRMSYAVTYAFQKYVSQITDIRRYVADTEIGHTFDTKRHFVMKHKLALSKERFSDMVESETEPKLYYACVPESIVRYGISQKTIPPISFGKPWKGIPDDKIAVVMEGKKFIPKKIKALKAHLSQSQDVRKFLETPNNPLISREFFILRMQGKNEVFMGKKDTVKNRL